MAAANQTLYRQFYRQVFTPISLPSNSAALGSRTSGARTQVAGLSSLSELLLGGLAGVANLSGIFSFQASTT
jgi:hypothetical protein